MIIIFVFATFILPHTHTHTHTHTRPHTPHRVPQRQISLYKFISTCSDLLPAPLFPALMHMLVGLASSTHSAHHTFNYLKANSPSLGTITSLFIIRLKGVVHCTKSALIWLYIIRYGYSYLCVQYINSAIMQFVYTTLSIIIKLKMKPLKTV